MSGKKILMLVGEFSEEYEIFVFEQAMHAVGHTVHVVCPDKKAGEILKTSLHDFEGHQTYTEKPGHHFTLNASFADAEAKDYHALMLTGGRAPEYLRLDPRVIALVRAFAAEDKPIAAICHAVQILAAADVIRGRRVAGYAACAPEVRLAGGEYVETPPDGAIRDGNLVTGFAWPAHPQWLSLFLSGLGARVDIG